jgi:uncharacterized metal-binding protein
MASGRSHDRATSLLALPFGLLWWPLLGWMGSVVACGAFLIGGLWLSPDLDTHSRATLRWGPLALLWWPYRRWLPHRSLISHSPFLGSAGRLLYLALLLTFASLLLQPWGTPGPSAMVDGVRQLWSHQRPLLVAALVGVELSGWLHLLQDGDPLPRLRFRPLRLSLWAKGRGRVNGRGRRGGSSRRRSTPHRRTRQRR